MRWATFDCYGTLIDWNGGIAAELARISGDAPGLLERYHKIEPVIQREQPAQPYREVLALTLDALAAETGLDLTDRYALARSLPDWAPFPEVREALGALRDEGWRLAILSNSDSDLLEASITRIGVPIDLTIVAGEIGSYKPAHRHWEEFFARSGTARQRHVHVAASHFHDIAPASELGLTNVWINRLAERAEPKPTRELADLVDLPRTLAELVPR